MSPRIDPAERRAEILDAAMRCFARTGYNGTSMDDVVRESGLSKGTLYWHFANKQDLFLAAFDQVMAAMMSQLDMPVEDSQSPTAMMRALFTMMLQAVEHMDIMTVTPLNFLIELWQLDAFAEHYQAALTPFVDAMAGIIAQGIASGEFREVDPGVTAWGISAALDGYILYAMIRMPEDIGRSGEALADMLLAGLLNKS